VHEVIEIHWVPFQQALDWCMDGAITDAKTLIGLFRAARLLNDPAGSAAGRPAAT
jgi:ADP-ribose pyrophosphatase